MVELASPDSGAASPREGAMIGIVAALVIVLVFIAAAVITSHSGNSAQKVTPIQSNGQTSGAAATPTTKATTTTATTTSTSTTTTTTTSTTVPGPGDINAEPAGVQCRQLARRGYDYAAVVTYWEAQGKPARMDVDGNGKPCETAYPPQVVDPYWNH